MKIICIGGASGSGKTIFAHNLLDSLPELDICVIDMDSFYRNSHLDFNERRMLNYDHPDIIEHTLLSDALQKLQKNICVDIPQYDFTVHNRSNKTRRIYPPDVIVIEGIFGLYYDDIIKMADLTIFMEVEEDIAISRRFVRDINERGRDAASVMSQYLKTVRPMYHRYVKDTREKADIIVHSNFKYAKLLEMLRIYLGHK